MGRSGIHFTRERVGSKKALRSSGRRFWFGQGLLTRPSSATGGLSADYRGGVTCLYDTQLPGACLHASESGGRSRPGAVRGMPNVPIAPPATGPPEGWAAVGLVSPASFNRGLWARLLGVLGS